MANTENQGVQNPINRDVNAAQRASLALKLRVSKVGYDDIASKCGYGSAGAAHKAIQRELKRTIVTNVEELRREECVTLDLMQKECMTLFLDRKNEKRLFAADRILAIMERRAKLMCLDMQPEERATQQNYTKRIVLVPQSQEAADANAND